MVEKSNSKSAYLACAGEGPVPSFRSECREAFQWPEEAVFAIVFHRTDFPTFPWEAHYEGKESFVEFYDSDGWPIGFPGELKKTLSTIMKKEFQVYPRDWRTRRCWREPLLHPELYPRMRAQAGLAGCLTPFLPGPVNRD